MKTTKIQRFARGKDCCLRIPGICRTTPENEDVVLAHAPYPGRGGTRLHDWWAAPACMKCHDMVDMREGYDLDTSNDWLSAIHEWQEMLIKEGLMNVQS